MEDVYKRQHLQLAVRLEARQHAGGMIVVEQLAAELQIQLTAEFCDTLLDLLRLCLLYTSRCV